MGPEFEIRDPFLYVFGNNGTLPLLNLLFGIIINLKVVENLKSELNVIKKEKSL
jgi:hypothetical protein